MKIRAADVDGGGFAPANLRREKHPPLSPEKQRAIAQLCEVLKHAPKVGDAPRHRQNLKCARCLNGRCSTCRKRKAAESSESQTQVIEQEGT